MERSSVIKSITITNFQSHEETHLDFHPGVNVISGRSNSGKSAIIRAINWFATNRPRGFDFHSDFAEDAHTTVTVVLDDGTTLKVDRSKAKMTYYINEKSFVGANEIPDEFVKKLNLSEINIASQLDPPFLVTDSPGEVGKVINRITRAEAVDAWVKDLTSRVNDVSKEIQILTDESSDLSRKLETYKLIPEIDKQLSVAEDQVVKLRKLEEDIQRLTTLSSEIRTREEALSEWSTIISDLGGILKKLESDFIKYERFEKESERLEGAVDQITSCENDLRKVTPFIDMASELLDPMVEQFNQYMEASRIIIAIKSYCESLALVDEVKHFISDAQPIIESSASYLEVSKSVSQLDDIVRRIEFESKAMLGIEDSVQKSRDDLRQTLLQVQQCPLCGAPVLEKQIDSLIEGMCGHG
jgi:exonuclease SbcC